MAGKTLAIAAVGLITAVMAATGASAETRWRYDHPRRAEVNARLAHQAHRIHVERREHEISAARAHRLHAEDHSIRRQERAYARMDHGHISKAEQRALNQEENHVSHQIRR